MTTATTPAPLRVRRDAGIFGTDGGWFAARWHFSFDQYHDPKHMNVGYLRVFNHDTLRPGAVWPMHPHRDVEGITWVVEGEFEHADSMGNGGVLLPGGVQRMTLGSGANHSERNHSPDKPMQFIQMWILPSRRGLQPAVEQAQTTVDQRQNRLLRILRPEGSAGEGVMVHQDVSMYVARLDPNHDVEHIFGPGRGGYAYVISGDARFNEELLTTGDAAVVEDAGTLRIAAQTTTELLLVDTPLV